MTSDQPPFDDDEVDWGEWVLENGLPDPPTALNLGDAVPIAVWKGASAAAVLVLSRYLDHDDPGDPESPVEDRTDADVFPYWRDGDEWRDTGGSGGGSWWHPSPFDPPAVDPTELALFNFHTSGATDVAVAAAYGLVGSEVHAVEVVEGSVASRQTLGPSRVIVVAARREPGRPSPFVRALDRNGRELARTALDVW